MKIAYNEQCRLPCRFLGHLQTVKLTWPAPLVGELKALAAEEARIEKAIEKIDGHIRNVEERRTAAHERVSAGTATADDLVVLEGEPIEKIRERYDAPKRHLREEMEGFQKQKVRPVLHRVVGQINAVVATEYAKFEKEIRSIHDRLGLDFDPAEDDRLLSIERWRADAEHRLIGQQALFTHGCAAIRAVLGDCGPI